MIGSIANNRFLQRVNPEIKRALNETGAAASMRQMVDLDIAKNLVGWWHRDNVNTRVSGSDTFVTQANDSSGGTNDAAQATNDNQPKLVSLGMGFDGSKSMFGPPSNIIRNTHSFSVSMWLKSYISSAPDNANAIMFSRLSDSEGVALGTYIRINGSALECRYRSGGVNYSLYFLDDNINTNVYYQCTYVWDISNTKFTIYLDGEYCDEDVCSIGDYGTMPILIGGRNDGIDFNDQYWDGMLNDIRIFNKALSADEISAIYNQTKGAYGL